MLKNFKLFYFLLVAIFFSTSSLMASQMPNKKNHNLYAKLKTSKKNRKLKKRNNKKLSKKTYQSKSRLVQRKANEKKLPFAKEDNFEFVHFNDVETAEEDIIFKIFFSDYGYRISCHMQKLLDCMKDLYTEAVKDVPIYDDPSSDLTNLYIQEADTDIPSLIEDIYKVNNIQKYLCKSDYISCEKEISSIGSESIKDFSYDLLFQVYLRKKELKKAEDIFNNYLAVKEDNEYELNDYKEDLIIKYLQSKEFDKAKNLTDTISDEWHREDCNLLIVKYLSRFGDVDGAYAVIEKANFDDSNLYDAYLYIADYFARTNNQKEFDKILKTEFSNSWVNEEFHATAKFILNIYQNDFVEAEKIYYNEDISFRAIENLIEIFASSNQIDEARVISQSFQDDWEQEEMNLYFVNAYLQNNQIEEASQIRDDIKEKDMFDRFIASKLIADYHNQNL